MNDQELNEKILALRAQNKGRKWIAKELGITEYRVRVAEDDPGRGGAITNSLKYRADEAEKKKPRRPGITPEECLDDLRALIDRNPHRHVTQLAYMAEGNVHFLDWSAIFGDFEEFSRQAGLKPTRGVHELQRQIAKHASIEHYNKFYRLEVVPYVGQYERNGKNVKHLKVMVIGSDFHDIEVDRFALEVFIDTCRRLQPDIIVLNGDIFDLYEFSRYDIDPRRVAIVERFEFVRKQFFARLREACPDAQIDFHLGNHEWRLLKLLADSRNAYLQVLLHDVAGLTVDQIFGVREYEINLICKWDLAAFGRKDVNEQLQQNYKIYYDGLYAVTHIGPRNPDKVYGISGTSGHTHRPDLITWNNAQGKHSWVVTPALAQTNALYVPGLDQAQNGFNIAFIDTNKRSVIQQPILIPGDVAAVAGQLYHRRDYDEVA